MRCLSAFVLFILLVRLALPVGAQPVAAFSVSGDSLCAPAIFSAFNESQGNGSLSAVWLLNGNLVTDTSLHLHLEINGCGSYLLTLIIGDTTGAQDTASSWLTVFCPPAVSAGADASLCAGDTIVLFGTASAQVLWAPATGLGNPASAVTTCAPAQTTTYILTATDSNGCTASDSVTILVHAAPAVTLSPSSISLCGSDPPLLFTGQPAGGAFAGSGIAADGYFSPALAGPGNFQVWYTFTDLNGCTSSDTSYVQVLPVPVLNVSGDVAICSGDTAALSASGTASVSWWPATGLSDAGSASPLAFPQQTTRYYVTGSDGFCSVTDSVLVTVIPLPAVSAGNDTTACAGTPLWLLATGAVQYAWSPPNLVSNPNAAWTQYTGTGDAQLAVTGTNAQGCSATDTLLISYISIGSPLIITPDTLLCIGQSVQLAAAAADSYSWSPAAGLSNANIANPLASPAATVTYTLTATVGPCAFSDQILISVKNLPPVNAGPPLTNICTGDSVQLTATGALTYSWSPTDNLSNASIANPLAYPTDTTLYTVTGTDVYGCKNTDSILVIVLPAPQVYVFGDTSLCAGDTIAMYATGGLYYSWQPVSSLSMPLNFSTLAYPEQTTTYTVTAMDFKGCTGTATHTVVVHPKPTATASGPGWVCPGQPAQLQAGGGLYYSWQPATGLSNAFVSNPVAVTYSNITYTVTVSNAYFCSDTAQVHLKIHPPLQTWVSSDTVVCMGGVASLQAGGGLSYEWWPTESLTANQGPNTTASPLRTTTYQVRIAGYCETDTLFVTVIVQAPPLVNAGGDRNAVAGVPITLSAVASPGTYAWTPASGLSCANCLNPTVTLLETTTFVLTVTDAVGCTASDTITVRVGCDDQVVFVPNVFTPNGNGANDILYVRSQGIEDLIFFRIYDRWGKRIFESASLDHGWDGRYNGKDMPAGTYLYEWQARCRTGELVHRFGNVTLLR